MDLNRCLSEWLLGSGRPSPAIRGEATVNGTRHAGHQYSTAGDVRVARSASAIDPFDRGQDAYVIRTDLKLRHSRAALRRKGLYEIAYEDVARFDRCRSSVVAFGLAVRNRHRAGQERRPAGARALSRIGQDRGRVARIEDLVAESGHRCRDAIRPVQGVGQRSERSLYPVSAGGVY